MYTDAGVWARTLTDSEYAKTRAPGRNITVVVEGLGVLDSAGDALGMARRFDVLVHVLSGRFPSSQSTGVQVKMPPVRAEVLQSCQADNAVLANLQASDRT